MPYGAAYLRAAAGQRNAPIPQGIVPDCYGAIETTAPLRRRPIHQPIVPEIIQIPTRSLFHHLFE